MEQKKLEKKVKELKRKNARLKQERNDLRQLLAAALAEMALGADETPCQIAGLTDVDGGDRFVGIVGDMHVYAANEIVPSNEDVFDLAIALDAFGFAHHVKIGSVCALDEGAFREENLADIAKALSVGRCAADDPTEEERADAGDASASLGAGCQTCDFACPSASEALAFEEFLPEACGITVDEARLLGLHKARPELTQGQLAQALGTSKAAVSKTIAGLSLAWKRPAVRPASDEGKEIEGDAPSGARSADGSSDGSQGAPEDQ